MVELLDEGVQLVAEPLELALAALQSLDLFKKLPTLSPGRGRLAPSGGAWPRSGAGGPRRRARRVDARRQDSEQVLA